MSFFGKFKTGTTTTTVAPTPKKDPHGSKPTLLDKHLLDYSDPIRADGSDKFFGLENYGSTCYANSVIQCLYYSEPFREHVLSFPSASFVEEWKSRPHEKHENGSVNGSLSPSRTTAPATPYPNPTSPARKATVPNTATSAQKAEENKDSPEYKKKMAIQVGPVLDMTQDKSYEYGMDESLFTSLKDIFSAIIADQSRIGVVSPHKFLEILRKENEMFRSAMHQDAHEFLNLLLNSVVEKVEHFSKQLQDSQHSNGSANGSVQLVKKEVQASPDARWVHDIFEGVLTSETRCLTCETVSQRDEAFLDLSVDLSPHTSVTSCLRKFSQEEMLCERNKFHCDNCGGLQEAEKRMKIKRLPQVLALHLKRFKYTEDLQRLQKLFHKVVYPFHLRLFNTTDDAEDSDRLYELYAVVVHIGGGPYHGHYVSIVKTQDRGWLLFDDELVEPVDKNYVLNFFGGEPVPGTQDARQLACAYVLFYQQTTEEAVLCEQEAERKAHEAAASVPAAEQTKEPAKTTDPFKNDAFKLLGLGTPPQEPPEHMATTPILPPANGPALAPLEQTKSKKELKAEDKERKATQKSEEKLAIQKQREASEKRVEAMRQQEEQLNKAQEASRLSYIDENKKSGEIPQEKSGFGRFMRPGSVSLRSKPKLFAGRSHDVRNGVPEELPVALPHGAISDETKLNTLPNVPQPPPTVQPKEKKNRFSLGRKRSMQIF